MITAHSGIRSLFHFISHHSHVWTLEAPSDQSFINPFSNLEAQYNSRSWGHWRDVLIVKEIRCTDMRFSQARFAGESAPNEFRKIRSLYQNVFVLELCGIRMSVLVLMYSDLRSNSFPLWIASCCLPGSVLRSSIHFWLLNFISRVCRCRLFPETGLLMIGSIVWCNRASRELFTSLYYILNALRRFPVKFVCFNVRVQMMSFILATTQTTPYSLISNNDQWICPMIRDEILCNI